MIYYEALIEALANKDEEAFHIVYEQTRHAVYAMIVSIVKDQSMSEDIMQETYMTMLEKINQFQKGNNFLNWLLTIARNKAIDYYRRKQKEILVDQNETEYIFPETKAQGERNIIIHEVINNLDDKERQVFLLHIIENIPFRDIAKIIDMPIGTVLWHYHKAIKKIKK